MPKTTFVDGVTTVAASFLNKIFDHNHRGQDEDGSAPRIDLATEALLDTAGQPLKAPGHAVAWIVYEAGGSILASHNIDPGHVTLSGSVHGARLINPVRSDLDVTGTTKTAGAALITTNASGLIAYGTYSRSDNGTEDIERLGVNFLRLDGTTGTPPTGTVISIVAFANYPNGIG